ncbi:MAG: hypothetical protein COT71_04060 [Candidatus Andersenbacteria bacterium CG10_big_fil_rev_8_21_14_0_10_54_11]|uniref:Uncharacterized protein n=1 Tax=Candidatus Andersenbacteria bacterium CG10_big_fil_rev_8_21_14_0_10_54_11 TaxID=1974485 RepID=A0A2M6WYI4_9BACT|nr:MAG: hypothetical protein COT71_04060 [Candidatus Andersenbacteria bacterium CG10_big_fil_rev_8_21_14_0_10_54_11]
MKRTLLFLAVVLLASLWLHMTFWFLPFALTVPLYLTYTLRAPSRVLLPLASAAAVLAHGPASAAAVLLPLGVRRLLREPEVTPSFRYLLILFASAAGAGSILLIPAAAAAWHTGAVLRSVLHWSVPLPQLLAVSAASSVLVFAATVLHYSVHGGDV